MIANDEKLIQTGIVLKKDFESFIKESSLAWLYNDWSLPNSTLKPTDDLGSILSIVDEFIKIAHLLSSGILFELESENSENHADYFGSSEFADFINNFDVDDPLHRLGDIENLEIESPAIESPKLKGAKQNIEFKSEKNKRTLQDNKIASEIKSAKVAETLEAAETKLKSKNHAQKSDFANPSNFIEKEYKSESSKNNLDEIRYTESLNVHEETHKGGFSEDEVKYTDDFSRDKIGYTSNLSQLEDVKDTGTFSGNEIKHTSGNLSEFADFINNFDVSDILELSANSKADQADQTIPSEDDKPPITVNAETRLKSKDVPLHRLGDIENLEIESPDIESPKLKGAKKNIEYFKSEKSKQTLQDNKIASEIKSAEVAETKLKSKNHAKKPDNELCKVINYTNISDVFELSLTDIKKSCLENNRIEEFNKKDVEEKSYISSLENTYRNNIAAKYKSGYEPEFVTKNSHESLTKQAKTENISYTEKIDVNELLDIITEQISQEYERFYG